LSFVLKLNEEIDLDFASLFDEPIDLDPTNLSFTKDTSVWPSWISFYPDRGRLVGITNATMAPQTLTIWGTDKYGLSVDLLVTIEVVSQLSLTYIKHTNFKLKGNSTFSH